MLPLSVQTVIVLPFAGVLLAWLVAKVASRYEIEIVDGRLDLGLPLLRRPWSPTLVRSLERKGVPYLVHRKGR